MLLFVTVSDITIKYAKGAAALALELFGRVVTAEELAAAVSALESSAVAVSKAGHKLIVKVRHRHFKVQERHFFRLPDGSLIVKNEALEKTSKAPADIAIRSFLKQVEGARALGVKRILALAAGSLAAPGLIGYYLLARFGFDAPLTIDEIRFLPPPLARARTLNDLLLLGGKDWWRANGYDRQVFFELAENSSMMRVLRAYVAELKQQGRFQTE